MANVINFMNVRAPPPLSHAQLPLAMPPLAPPTHAHTTTRIEREKKGLLLFSLFTKNIIAAIVRG
jgi:hypothetical protein